MLVVQAESVLLPGLHGDDPRPLVAVIAVYHHLVFYPEPLLDDGGKTLLACRFEYEELIRRQGALHYHFAQAKGAVDHYHLPESGFGIQREGHAAAGKVRTHHLLDTDRKSDSRYVEVECLSIADGAVGEQGGETVADGVDQCGRPADIEKGLLLTRKTCVGQVFCRCRGADGHVG